MRVYKEGDVLELDQSKGGWDWVLKERDNADDYAGAWMEVCPGLAEAIVQNPNMEFQWNAGDHTSIRITSGRLEKYWHTAARAYLEAKRREEARDPAAIFRQIKANAERAWAEAEND